MKVFHVTPRKNKASIMELGLLLSYCHDDLGRVYFCSRGDLGAMVRTIKQRHEIADVCALYVDIGRTPYRRESAVSFFVERDILPTKILGELSQEHV